VSDLARVNPPALAKVDGATMAASLLLALGQEAAAEVLKALPEAKVAAIARAARTLRAVDERVSDVSVSRFIQTMERFETDRSTRTRAFENMLVAAIGQDAANKAMLDDGPSVEELAVKPLVDAEAADVALLLENESPEVIALVLSVLQPDKAKEVLAGLPIELQAPALQSLAGFEAIEPSYVNDVVSGLAQQVRELVQGPRRKPVAGERSALEILRRFKPDDRRELMEELSRNAPELTGRIKSKLFAFDDIARLPRKGIQQVLQACDSRSLALALKGAPPSVTDAIVANMSQRAAAALRDEIEMLGRVKLAQVERAQSEIVGVIMGLAEQGLIDIEMDGEEV
jgi:flagellar motor switch protein FliG